MPISTVNGQATAMPERPTAASTRALARIAGVLFLITFVTAIAGAVLYGPVLDEPDYVLGDGGEARIQLGALCELLLVTANIGTALVLFPILRRQNEVLALGYVAPRLVECALIAVGILSVLSILTLRQDAAGADAGSLLVAGQSLVAVKDWTFLLGPGLVVGVGNGLILGYLMYRSGLVPRRMAVLGLVGGPLICASGVAVMFDVIEPASVWQGIATIPEFLWELSLGIYLTVKGFRPSSPLLDPAPSVEDDTAPGPSCRRRASPRDAAASREPDMSACAPGPEGVRSGGRRAPTGLPTAAVRRLSDAVPAPGPRGSSGGAAACCPAR